MGKIDAVICEYIADNERIADLFNGLYFQGGDIPNIMEGYAIGIS